MDPAEAIQVVDPPMVLMTGEILGDGAKESTARTVSEKGNEEKAPPKERTHRTSPKEATALVVERSAWAAPVAPAPGAEKEATAGDSAKGEGVR